MIDEKKVLKLLSCVFLISGLSLKKKKKKIF